jgi:DHA1 family bicyclomycin/chloramphenicol resistance-like MFS transporter
MPRPPAARSIGEREFVVLMGLIQALQALAIDSMLPALGTLSGELGVTSANQRQLVVGIFLIGSGLGSLIPGPLADRFGRRPVLLSCLGLYVALSAGCGLVTGFPMLVVLRLAVGLASAGLTVLPAAIIRDRLEGDRMARMQSVVSMVFMIVPMVAPSLGLAVLMVAGWRWIFGVMALLAAMVAAWTAVRLPETLRPEFRQPFHPARMLRSLATVITCREASGYVLGLSLVQAALFGYINSTQQLVAEHFGAGQMFPLIFGGMAVAMASTNFVNSRIVVRFGARAVSHSAMLAYIAVSLAQLALAMSGRETLWSFVPLMTLNLCLMGFIGANFSAIALQPFARSAGAAAGAQAFVRMLLAASLGAAIGQAYDGTARPLAFALVMAGCGALTLVLVSEKGRLFHARSRPPEMVA